MNGSLKDDYYHDYILERADTRIKRVVVVSHVIETSEEFLLSLNKNIGIALLIPKLSSMQRDIYDKLKSSIPIRAIKKEDIRENNKRLMKYFKEVIGKEPFAICDIGGYFSKILLELDHEFGDSIQGIVEDTENGLNKYKIELSRLKKNGKKINFPIVSVAQSPLKECEDYLVGKEIGLKSEIFLSKNEIPIFGKKVLVLGFGKIGRSVAMTFRERGTYVTIIDTNPIRQSLAISYGFRTGQLHEELNNNDLVICATGNHCIGLKDILHIRNKKVFFFSVTSSDDEFYKYERMMKAGSIDENNNLIIKLPSGGKAVFVHNGSAINFKESRSILSNNIKLVQSELCEAICSLHEFDKGKISEISQKKRELLADYWLRVQNM